MKMDQHSVETEVAKDMEMNQKNKSLKREKKIQGEIVNKVKFCAENEKVEDCENVIGDISNRVLSGGGEKSDRRILESGSKDSFLDDWKRMSE